MHELACTFLTVLYVLVLFTHCAWAVVVHFLMKLPGGIPHRMYAPRSAVTFRIWQTIQLIAFYRTRLAYLSPLVPNGILLVCLQSLDSEAQDQVFPVWLAVQIMIASISAPLLWWGQFGEIIFTGWSVRRLLQWPEKELT